MAWSQAQTAERLNPDKWRKDACGAWISWQQFGNKDSAFGWEIVPEPPQPGPGGEENLQPFQWKNAASRKEGAPACKVIAWGGDNITLD